MAALLNGGAVPGYRCDEPDKCLNPTRTTRDLAAADGFKARVETLMVNMVTALENDTPPGKAEKALVNMTALPVYRLLADYSLYEGVLARNEAHTIAEAVALDVLHLYLKESQKDMAAPPADCASPGRTWRNGARPCATTAPPSRAWRPGPGPASTPPWISSKRPAPSKAKSPKACRAPCSTRSPTTTIPERSTMTGRDRQAGGEGRPRV